jgi:hypothetical protein
MIFMDPTSAGLQLSFMTCFGLTKQGATTGVFLLDAPAKELEH